ncbi:hypothetical protein [Ottowia massiliensis]|nr:hypothetical protein [Ottowia massiliensis]
MGSFTADGQLQSQSWPDGSRQDFAWEKAGSNKSACPTKAELR